MLRSAVFAIALLFTIIACADDIPNLDKTPGAVRKGLTKEKICATKWGQDQPPE